MIARDSLLLGPDLGGEGVQFGLLAVGIQPLADVADALMDRNPDSRAVVDEQVHHRSATVQLEGAAAGPWRPETS
jgi:hypothetical protein